MPLGLRGADQGKSPGVPGTPGREKLLAASGCGQGVGLDCKSMGRFDRFPEPARPKLAFRIDAGSRAWGSGFGYDNIERFGSSPLHAQGDVLARLVFSDYAMEIRVVVDNLPIGGQHDFSFP